MREFSYIKSHPVESSGRLSHEVESPVKNHQVASLVRLSHPVEISVRL